MNQLFLKTIPIFIGKYAPNLMLILRDLYIIESNCKYL